VTYFPSPDVPDAPPAYGPPGYGPPGYSPPGYGPPAYAPPGYAPSPYAQYPQPGAGFGAPAPAYGYPPPVYGYPPPGYGYPSSNARPGAVVAASVLGYVLAGLLIVAGIFLLSLASSTSQIADTFDLNGASITAELTFDGLLNFLAAGLLIGGGVGFTTGRRAGRKTLVIGNAITLGAAIYWVSRTSGNNGAVVWVLLFSALAVVGIGLAFSTSINTWLAQRSA
jgi:hypothetical protein